MASKRHLPLLSLVTAVKTTAFVFLACLVVVPAFAAPPFPLEGLLARAKIVCIGEVAVFDGTNVALKVETPLRGHPGTNTLTLKVYTACGRPEEGKQYFVFSQGHDHWGEPKNEIMLSQGIKGQASYTGWIMLPIERENGKEVVKNAFSLKFGEPENAFGPLTMEQAKQLVRETTFEGTMVLAQGNVPAAEDEGKDAVDTMAGKIEKGDPDVVPVLRQWLAQESDKNVFRDAPRKLALALQGIGAYRDANSVELISFFYTKAVMGSVLRQMAANALASIGAKESSADLKTIVWDQSVELATRCKAASVLVELDEDLGREFLLLQYDLYRLELKTMNAQCIGPVRDELEQLDDPKLVSALEKRIPDEPVTTLRNNIKTLIKRMAVNAEPLESLKTTATNTSWAEGHGRRYAAIEVLGRKGGPECIPFLESLRPWAGIAADPNTVRIQQEFLKEYASKAVVAIRQRHWKH